MLFGPLWRLALFFFRSARSLSNLVTSAFIRNKVPDRVYPGPREPDQEALGAKLVRELPVHPVQGLWVWGWHYQAGRRHTLRYSIAGLHIPTLWIVVGLQSEPFPFGHRALEGQRRSELRSKTSLHGLTSCNLWVPDTPQHQVMPIRMTGDHRAPSKGEEFILWLPGMYHT